METVWIVIGFTIVNVAWIIALNMVLDREEEERQRIAEQVFKEREALMRERHSLLDRIQAPERPAAPWIDPNPLPPPEPNEPEIGLVGTVIPDIPPEPGE